jgi:hypothetical protein
MTETSVKWYKLAYPSPCVVGTVKITDILTAFFNQEIIMKCPEGSNYTIPQMKGLRTITQETLTCFSQLDIYRSLSEL